MKANVPWFFVPSHQNYARWIPVLIHDMDSSVISVAIHSQMIPPNYSCWTHGKSLTSLLSSQFITVHTWTGVKTAPTTTGNTNCIQGPIKKNSLLILKTQDEGQAGRAGLHLNAGMTLLPIEYSHAAQICRHWCLIQATQSPYPPPPPPPLTGETAY
jgi:hypothetical protein